MRVFFCGLKNQTWFAFESEQYSNSSYYSCQKNNNSNYVNKKHYVFNLKWLDKKVCVCSHLLIDLRVSYNVDVYDFLYARFGWKLFLKHNRSFLGTGSHIQKRDFFKRETWSNVKFSIQKEKKFFTFSENSPTFHFRLHQSSLWTLYNRPVKHIQVRYVNNFDKIISDREKKKESKEKKEEEEESLIEICSVFVKNWAGYGK